MHEDERVKKLAGLREVKGVKVGGAMSVNELVTGLRGCAFGAGRLAKAVDIYGAESNWSEFIITMPRNKVTYSSFLLNLLEQIPLLQRLLDIWRIYLL